MGNRFREKVVEEGLEVNELPVAEGAGNPGNPEEGNPQDSQDSTKREKKTSGKSDKAARGIGRVLGGDVLAEKLVLKRAAKRRRILVKTRKRARRLFRKVFRRG